MGTPGGSAAVCDRARCCDTRGVPGVRGGTGLRPPGILERAGVGLASRCRRGASTVLEARGAGTLAAAPFRYVGAAGAAPPCAARELVGGGGILPLGGTKIADRG